MANWNTITTFKKQIICQRHSGRFDILVEFPSFDYDWDNINLISGICEWDMSNDQVYYRKTQNRVDKSSFDIVCESFSIQSDGKKQYPNIPLNQAIVHCDNTQKIKFKIYCRISVGESANGTFYVDVYKNNKFWYKQRIGKLNYYKENSHGSTVMKFNVTVLPKTFDECDIKIDNLHIENGYGVSILEKYLIETESFSVDYSQSIITDVNICFGEQIPIITKNS